MLRASGWGNFRPCYSRCYFIGDCRTKELIGISYEHRHQIWKERLTRSRTIMCAFRISQASYNNISECSQLKRPSLLWWKRLLFHIRLKIGTPLNVAWRYWKHKRLLVLYFNLQQQCDIVILHSNFSDKDCVLFVLLYFLASLKYGIFRLCCLK